MSSLNARLSRDDYRKFKELEELRKTGAAPPEVDEDGEKHELLLVLRAPAERDRFM